MTSMTEPVRVSRRRARQLAVTGQLLDAPRPGSIEEVVRRLGEVQIDPTSAVARTEQLVLFSRLGRRFRVAELERLLWGERALFEYWAHIVPTADLPIHRISMRRYPHGTWKRREYVRGWLEANAAFVRYVIGELRRRGPLRARDLENRAAEGWQTGGWNDEGQNVPMLLDILWLQGRVMIVGHDGQQGSGISRRGRSHAFPRAQHPASPKASSTGSCARAVWNDWNGSASCSTDRFRCGTQRSVGTC